LCLPCCVCRVAAVWTADFADLLDMVSISTLFAFWIVALALMWHRCFEPSRHSPVRVALLSAQLFVMVAACIGECPVL
jgi:amino acid transporter